MDAGSGLMATINKLLMFRALSQEETSWRGEVVAIDEDLQQVKVKRGDIFASWISNSLSLVVGDQVIAKNKAVVSKLPLATDYVTLEL